ncbi:MAG: DUF1579 family protein [Planctomycetes bacterium]|nr:DUF1579 family protein [Planctomycetota bacterium]MBI3845256.1 DUF1579 family protein [Planctomycetota bacterium]
MFRLVLAVALAGLWFAVSDGPQDNAVHDDLLDKMVGKWHITREFSNRKAENDATVEWVIDHHYLRISMKGGEKPNLYEAHVYITFEAAAKRYVVHWMDLFAGSLPETLGYGEKVGESIVFTWKDAGGTLKNTFAWHAESQTWTSKIEQTDKDGKWSTFCTDTYRRVEG